MALSCEKHSVYVYDRGGKTRLGMIYPVSSITWNRVRDDISVANILTAGPEPGCCDLLANTEPGRHELVVYRGDERVWEGPITRMGFHRDSVEIEARDVCQYLYRLVLSKTYDNRVLHRNQAGNCPYVADHAHLPTGLSYADNGKCYVTLDTGHWWQWVCGTPPPPNCKWVNTAAATPATCTWIKRQYYRSDPKQPDGTPYPTVYYIHDLPTLGSGSAGTQYYVLSNRHLYELGCYQESVYYRTIPTVADLPDDLGPRDDNKKFIIHSTNRIYTWDCGKQPPVNCSWVDRGVTPDAETIDQSDTVNHRIQGIITYEIARLEALNPPVNVLPFMVVHNQKSGDARTTRYTVPYQQTVWEHLDDLAHRSGIDYTVVGRALHIWDHNVILWQTVQLTEHDFIGEVIVSSYGMELGTVSIVTDGQGHVGMVGGTDPYYGRWERLNTAYDETSGTSTPTSAEMGDQATRNLRGRNPTPVDVRVPDGSQLNPAGPLTITDLVPGTHIPLKATLTCRTVDQMQILNEVQVTETPDGETITVTLTPASDLNVEDNPADGG